MKAQNLGFWSFASSSYPFCLTSDQVSSTSVNWLARKWPKTLKKCMKIGRLWVDFSPWRQWVGKNLMRYGGKRIYCRFRISNQIFGSSYRSRDIGHSLDTTFAIFGQNLNFVDEYLENGKCYWKSDLIFGIYDKFSFPHVSSDFFLLVVFMEKIWVKLGQF